MIVRRPPLLSVLPPKASRDARVRRRLVYLDQNVLTGLAKLELGREYPDDLGAATTQLRDAIRLSVGEGQDAVCVESMFHRAESSGLVLGPRQRKGADELFEAISRLLTLLSFGLKFSTCADILASQTVLAVALELGRDAPAPEARWRLALSRDPQMPNERAGVEVGGSLFVVGAAWEPSLLPEAAWADRVTRMRTNGEFASFDAAAERGIRERRSDVVDKNELVPWGNRWSARPRDRIARADVDRFIASDSLFQVPILYASMHLYADVLSDKTRRFKDSDPNDIDILSLAIPYCDLVVTDKHMFEVATRRGLDTAFGTTVLPATPDGLSRAAKLLAKRL